MPGAGDGVNFGSPVHADTAFKIGFVERRRKVDARSVLGEAEELTNSLLRSASKKSGNSCA